MLLIFVLWMKRLVKRGSAILKSSKVNKKVKQAEDHQEGTIPNEELLRLAKAFVTSKMEFKVEQEEEDRKHLTDQLEFEYNRLKGHALLRARQLMMLRIRHSLVQHPYDQIGRRIAAETRDVFKRYVLKEESWLHRFEGIVNLPKALQKHSPLKRAFLMMPLLISTVIALKKGLVYSHDMVSDILVIKEIQESIDTFKIPELSNITSFTEVKLITFILEDIQEYGLPAIKDSCEVLDLIQKMIEDTVPLYKFLVSHAGNIHWNPNRNSTLDITEPFQILKVLPKIYKEMKRGWNKGHEGKGTFWNITEGTVRSITKTLKDAKLGIGQASSGFTGFMARLAQIDINSEIFIPMLDSAISILNMTDKEIIRNQSWKMSNLLHGPISTNQKTALFLAIILASQTFYPNWPIFYTIKMVDDQHKLTRLCFPLIG